MIVDVRDVVMQTICRNFHTRNRAAQFVYYRTINSARTIRNYTIVRFDLYVDEFTGRSDCRTGLVRNIHAVSGINSDKKVWTGYRSIALLKLGLSVAYGIKTNSIELAKA